MVWLKAHCFLAWVFAKDTGAPWVFYLLFIPALALAGAPLTSGAAAKDILKLALDAGHSGWIHMFVGLLFVSTFGATLLMARFLNLIRPYTTDSTSHGAGLALPWLGLLVLVLAFPLVVDGWSAVSNEHRHCHCGHGHGSGDLVLFTDAGGRLGRPDTARRHLRMDPALHPRRGASTDSAAYQVGVIT